VDAEQQKCATYVFIIW